MYYKVKMDGDIVDALENPQCVYYFSNIKRLLRCGKKDTPEGIISSDGQHIWHVEGWPELIGDYDTVELVEIEEEEYNALRALLDAGEQPEESLPEPDPEPETDEETLAWAKKQKIALSKTMLAAFLEQNPLVSSAHGGTAGTYSVTEEKQQLMSLNYNTYQIKKAAGVKAELTWNETGKECEVWTEAEYIQLIIEIEAYVKPLVSAQQGYEKQIQEAETLREVNAVEISY